MDRNSGQGPLGLATGVVANVLMIGVFVYLAGLEETAAAAYQRAVLPGSLVAWASFAAFGLASFVWLQAARARRAQGLGSVGWLLVAALCAVLGLDQLAWGQHLFGAVPPPHLPAAKQTVFQLRALLPAPAARWILIAVLGVFGVLLPLLAGKRRRAAQAAGLPLLPLGLAPAFLAALILELVQPWRLTHEVTELMLGVGLMFAGLLQSNELPASTGGSPRSIPRLVAAFLAVIVVGSVAGSLTRTRQVGSSAYLEAAQIEMDALIQDFEARAAERGLRSLSRCGMHTTISRYSRYRGTYLRDGAFRALEGLPERRSRRFLDPWESAYRIRHECGPGRKRQVFYIYSAGPDGVIEEDAWALPGDDLRRILRHQGEPPEGRKSGKTFPLRNSHSLADGTSSRLGSTQLAEVARNRKRR